MSSKLLASHSGLYSLQSMSAHYAGVSISLLSKEELAEELVAIDLVLSTEEPKGIRLSTCRCLITLINERLAALDIAERVVARERSR